MKLIAAKASVVTVLALIAFSCWWVDHIRADEREAYKEWCHEQGGFYNRRHCKLPPVRIYK